jgi:trk system potassium uptake protein TrkH
VATMLLIILGGLGFPVWWDVLDVIKRARKKEILWQDSFAKLNVHSKLVLVMSAFLIFGGGVLIFLFEFHNPETIGNMSLFGKIQASFFQSVTTRTAGFFTIPQENLTNATSIVSVALMIIGGSPVGTAGGIKTVTIIVLIVSSLATIRNKDNSTLFNRTISLQSIKKAVAVVTFFVIIMFTSVTLLSLTTNAPMLDLIYESASATATVGLSRNLTASLNDIGKLIIILTMYLGRVGPITLAIALGSKTTSQNIITEPTEEICIG